MQPLTPTLSPQAGRGGKIDEEFSMRAEIEAVVAEIQQSVGLLRRHL